MSVCVNVPHDEVPLVVSDEGSGGQSEMPKRFTTSWTILCAFMACSGLLLLFASGRGAFITVHLPGLVELRDDTVCDDTGFKNFVEQLWSIDEGRLEPGVDYELDLQGQTTYSFSGDLDEAEKPLFVNVNAAVFDRPSVKAFIDLLDNYEPQTGVSEFHTLAEEQENWAFLNIIWESKPMQLAVKFLKYKGKLSRGDDDGTIKRDLYRTWFEMYVGGQNRNVDSSGFEHVFVGETREDNGDIIGFQNWIQMYMLENAGDLDYKGYIQQSNVNPHLLALRFSWKSFVKPKSSLLIGTSPEFEVALYTVGFYMGYTSYNMTLGGEVAVMKCHRRNLNMASAYVQMIRNP